MYQKPLKREKFLQMMHCQKKGVFQANVLCNIETRNYYLSNNQKLWFGFNKRANIKVMGRTKRQRSSKGTDRGPLPCSDWLDSMF